MSRKDLDDLTLLAKQLGAKGLAWTFIEENGWRSPISKFFDEALLEEISARMEARPVMCSSLLPIPGKLPARCWDTCVTVLPRQK
jgi:aspartyl-tRNA synthetase